MKEGFMYIIVDNTMDKLQFIENGDYTGSSGLFGSGNNPDDLKYKLDASPDQPVDGVVFKICLSGYGTKGSTST